MALYETRINDVTPDLYDAHLVKYTVGPADYSDGYTVPPTSMKPVALTPVHGSRTITLTFDFEGDDQHIIALGISRMTANLQTPNSVVQLPDGFYYHCNYVKAGDPTEKAPWIWQVKFTLVGWRTGGLERFVLSSSSKIDVDGNIKTPAIISVTPSVSGGNITIAGLTFKGGTGSITITGCTGEVIIDGIAKTVMDTDGNNLFAQTDLTEFPWLSAGENTITISGAATATISFWPAFI